MYRPGDEQPTEIDRSDPLIGSVLDGRFRLDARIAAGGMGAIYSATQSPSGRKVAIKILHPDLATDPKLVARFQREGAALSRLRDPHTVTTYEIGADRDGTLFIAMELLGGESLFQRLLGGPLPWQRAVAIARQICDSLAEAHAIGLVHRDLKPGNVQLEGDFAKVLDFGIAKPMRGSQSDDGEQLTAMGMVLGTCEYMAPEQMMGRACTPQSDLYSLGIVLYEMLTGRRPFAEITSAQPLLAAILTRAPVPPSARMTMPAALDPIVLACLAPEPTGRYPEMAELARALDVLVDPTRTQIDQDEAVTHLAPPRAAVPKIAIEPSTEVTVRRPREPAPAPRPGTLPAYDMNRIETREAWVRRIIWIVVGLIVVVAAYLVRSI